MRGEDVIHVNKVEKVCGWILLGLVWVGFSSCSRAVASANPAPAARVLKEPIVRWASFVRRMLLTGELKALQAIEIRAPRTPGGEAQIRWMEADGSLVVVGQRILEFDNSTFVSSREEKKLAVRSAQSDLARQEAVNGVDLATKQYAFEKARIELEKAKIDADVPRELLSGRDYQDKRLAAEKASNAFDKTKDELEAAQKAGEAEMAIRRISLNAAQKELVRIEEGIAKLTILAPRDGLLQIADMPWEGRKFQIGDAAWGDWPVMLMPSLDNMGVEARLFDVDDGAIAVGAAARCTVDAYPDQTFPGTVTRISPVAQETQRQSLRRAFAVSITLQSTDEKRMTPGMSVKIEVEGSKLDNVLVIPRGVVRVAKGKVLVNLSGKGETEVTLGPCSAQECVVTAGVKEGDRLLPMGRERV